MVTTTGSVMYAVRNHIYIRLYYGVGCYSCMNNSVA